MTPLLGFSPDVEPTTPGAILDAQGVIPYEAGMRAAPSPASTGVAALADACMGSAVVRSLTGSSRFFAGTASKLYEASGTSWSDVGGSYTLGTDDRWSFAGYGNDVLASNKATTIQRSTGGAFSAIAGAPKAKLLVASKGFVVAFDTNEGVYGDSPDRWWCSALFNVTDWTPSISTQCATGRLIGGSGPVNAAVRFGDDIVAYKSRAIFLMTYVGGDAVWASTQVGFDVGCVGPEAAVDTSIGHIFVGSDDIYRFDGTRPVPIASGVVRQWWLNNSSAEYRYRTKLLWDRDNSLVWIHFPSSSSTGACDDCIVFHVGAQKWGRVSLTVQAVVSYVSAPFTYDGGHPLIVPGVTTYDDLPLIPFDSPFWLSQKSSPAIFDVSNAIKTLSGSAGSWSMRLFDFGDESAWSFLSAIRMRFATRNTSALTCTPIAKETSGSPAVFGAASSFDGSKFALRQTARFHSAVVAGVGDAKFSAVDPQIQPAGTR